MLSFKPTLTAQTGSRTDVRPGLLSTHPLSPQARKSVKFQFSSVAQLRLTLCDPMDCSTPGFPVPELPNSQSFLTLMSIESVMPSNHLILCCPLLLLSIFPSIRVFSVESVLHISWPEYWNFSFSSSPSNEYSGLISFRIDWLDLPVVSRYSLRSSFTVVRKHQFFGVQPFLLSSSHI